MGFPPTEAETLHQRYYRSYGLAIRGLVKHHQIDPLDYDEKCDMALPLDEILRPDPALVSLLSRLDRTKCRVIALTNAYHRHAKRVLKLVGLYHLIEACIFCDYALEDFACKPEPEYYLAVRSSHVPPHVPFRYSFLFLPRSSVLWWWVEGKTDFDHCANQAMDAMSVRDASQCYFVDDSLNNVKAAKSLGWKSSIHFDEAVPSPTEEGSDVTVQPPPQRAKGVDWTISHITQLEQLWPELLLPVEAPSDHPGRWKGGA